MNEKLSSYYQKQSDLAIAAVILDPERGLEYFHEETNTTYQNADARQEARNELEHWFQNEYEEDVGQITHVIEPDLESTSTFMQQV